MRYILKKTLSNQEKTYIKISVYSQEQIRSYEYLCFMLVYIPDP